MEYTIVNGRLCLISGIGYGKELLEVPSSLCKPSKREQRPVVIEKVEESVVLKEKPMLYERKERRSLTEAIKASRIQNRIEDALLVAATVAVSMVANILLSIF